MKRAPILFVLLLAACDNPPPAPLVPSPAPPVDLQETTPTFKVKFETSRGDFVVGVFREWAPNGADRFKQLVEEKFFDECRFFRVIPNFMAQFGIHGDPSTSAKWLNANLRDDTVRKSNKRGFITYATAGPNTRTTQVFINFKDNDFLDNQGFSPFGKILEGMDTVDSLHSGYGDGAPRGKGPDQGRLQKEGNAYLERDFKLLDYVKTARIIP